MTLAPTPMGNDTLPTPSPTRYVKNVTEPSAGAGVALWSMSMVSVFLSFVATYRLLKYFARLDTPFYAMFTVGLSWFLAFAGVLVLLPLDLVSELYNADFPEISIAWKVVYVLTWFLAWVFCALAGEYHLDGHFTFRSRMCSAIWTTVKTYLIILVVIVIVGIIVFFTVGISVQYIVAVSNFYGMFLIIIMLGYGLVELPMSLWRTADAQGALNSEFFRAGQVETARIDAEDKVDETVEEVVLFRNRLQRSNERDPQLEEYVELVLSKAPRRDVAMRGAAAVPGAGARAAAVARGAETPLTMGQLAGLHMRLKQALTAAERARWDWDYLLQRTAHLEKVIQLQGGSTQLRVEPAESSAASAVRSQLRGGITAPSSSSAASSSGVNGATPSPSPPPPGGDADEVGVTHNALLNPFKACARCLHNILSRHHWLLYHLAAWTCAIQSLILLWCAVVSPFGIHLSVFGLTLNNANDMVSIWLSSFWPLMYMAACCYMALFKFSYFDVLALHGNHQTDAYNLLYNASYLSRLQFALGVTYFGMLFPEDSADTAFHNLVGDMDTTRFTGVSFNKFSPVLILFFSIASFFNAGDRCLDFLGIGTHKRPRKGVQEHEERIAQGQELVARTRARMERERQRQFASAMSQYSVRAQGFAPNTVAGREGRYARVEDLLQPL